MRRRWARRLKRLACRVHGCEPDWLTAHLLALHVPHCVRCSRPVPPAGFSEEVGMTTTNSPDGEAW